MKKTLTLAILIGIALSGLSFLLISGMPRYTVSISHNETPEIGDQIIIKYPSWMSEETAKKSFKIKPEIAGQTFWFAESHELMFLPEMGFDTNIDYSIEVSSPSLLAAVGPLNKTYTFKVNTVNSGNEISKEIYTPQITAGKYIDINLKSMIIALFENGQIVKTFPVAGKGRPGRGATPEGKYKVLRKEPKHLSTISRAWMPWSLNFRNDGYYLHGWPYFANGQKVTVAYSLGCVRLYDGDDKELYDWAEVGTPVIIHSTTQAVIASSESSINDGNLVREGSDHKVYLIKILENKKFKRHIISADIEKWYSHLYPFWSKIKILNDGTLSDYKTSNWLRSENNPDAIYEIDERGRKHLVVCNNGAKDCLNTWALYGWDADEIYTVNDKELNFYPPGENIQLKLSPVLNK